MNALVRQTNERGDLSLAQAEPCCLRDQFVSSLACVHKLTSRSSEWRLQPIHLPSILGSHPK